MAIGSKGSFATVTSPPQVDFGALIRNAQEKQEEFNRREVAANAQFQNIKDAAIKGVKLPDLGTSKQMTGNAIRSKAAEAGREKIYQFRKSIESGEFGDMSVGDVRSMTQDIEGQLGVLKRTTDYISNPENDFNKMISEGRQSKGVSGSYFDLIGTINNGELEDVRINDNNKFTIVYKDKNGDEAEMTLEDYNKLLRNFPEDPDTKAIANSFADKFVANKIKKQEGSFIDRTTEGMTDTQAAEVKAEALRVASNPKYFNQVVFEAIGQQNVLTPQQLNQFTNEETGEPYTVEDIQNIYADKVVVGVKNRMKDTDLTEEDRTSRDRAIKRAEERRKEDESNVLKTKNPKIQREYTDVSTLVSLSNPKETEESVPLNGVEIVPNLTGRYVSDEGEEVTDTVKNFAVEAWIIDDNGNMVVRGANLEKENISQSSEEFQAGQDGKSIIFVDGRAKLPAATRRSSIVIDSESEAARTLTSAGLSEDEIQTYINEMRDKKSEETNDSSQGMTDEEYQEFLKENGIK